MCKPSNFEQLNEMYTNEIHGWCAIKKIPMDEKLVLNIENKYDFPSFLVPFGVEN